MRVSCDAEYCMDSPLRHRAESRTPGRRSEFCRRWPRMFTLNPTYIPAAMWSGFVYARLGSVCLARPEPVVSVAVRSDRQDSGFHPCSRLASVPEWHPDSDTAFGRSESRRCGGFADLGCATGRTGPHLHRHSRNAWAESHVRWHHVRRTPAYPGD